ncbi:unnamed protein product [Gordionus sp. m RMFG-2023]|uniref:zinc transporter ZIP12-like n=1 Tax=Gordionus sp. m RMFG-2023 TaxID=3053472 RepID=UPI0030E39C04
MQSHWIRFGSINTLQRFFMISQILLWFFPDPSSFVKSPHNSWLLQEDENHILNFTKFCLDQIFTKYGGCSRDTQSAVRSTTTLTPASLIELSNRRAMPEPEQNNNENAVINITQFTLLLSKIGLDTSPKSTNPRESIKKTKTDEMVNDINITTVSNNVNIVDATNVNNRVMRQVKMETSELNGDEFGKACLSPRGILNQFNMPPYKGITKHDFLAHICPVLIFQLDQDECRRALVPAQTSFVKSQQQMLSDSRYPPHLKTKTSRLIFAPKTWVYALISVFIISVVGFLLVLIFCHFISTNRSKSSKNDPYKARKDSTLLSQFCVALAVGSLAGDALLHLLPHAIFEANVNDHEHNNKIIIWKGFLTLSVLVMFFFFEKLMRFVSCWRNAHKNYSFEEDKNFGDDDKINDIHHRKNMIQHVYKVSPLEVLDDGCVVVCDQNNQKINPQSNDDDKARSAINNNNHSTLYPNQSNQNHDDSSNCTNTNSYTLLNQDEKNRIHNLDMPKSLKPRRRKYLSINALTVVFGDAFHNLFDGLAIGVAFSGSITAGISTAIAILCHELPHELGDFAYLINCGVKRKLCLLFNCFSSLCAVFGCLVGLFISSGKGLKSSVTDANYDANDIDDWIFCAISGMFLYISLSNMIPELRQKNESHHHDHHHHKTEESNDIDNVNFRGITGQASNQLKVKQELKYFIVQMGGITTGVTIMLLIALYEEDIKRLIS